MKKIVLSFCLATAALSAGPLTTTVQIVDVGASPLADSQSNDVGPYTLLINGKDVAAMCVDFRDETIVGTTWTVAVSTVGGDLSSTYNPGFTKKYEEEAYLYSLLVQPGADRIDIQHAAWTLTDPNYSANSQSQLYLNLAAANYTSIDFSNYEILSDVDSTGRQQEMLIASSAAPEPASYALFGLGLLFAGGYTKWRASANKAE